VADRRQRILTAAANLFAAKGYSSATMSDVVAVVGGSKATLYRHFPSKEALLRATLEMAAAAETDRLQALLDRKDPIADRIRDFTSTTWNTSCAPTSSTCDAWFAPRRGALTSAARSTRRWSCRPGRGSPR
jgi:AcrR family transcriptional regulator